MKMIKDRILTKFQSVFCFDVYNRHYRHPNGEFELVFFAVALIKLGYCFTDQFSHETRKISDFAMKLANNFHLTG